MRRHTLSRCGRQAIGILMGFMINAAAQADDVGVARVSDRAAEPTVRAQSPDDASAAIARVSYEPELGECPSHGIYGPSHGLVIGAGPGLQFDEDDWEDFQEAQRCELEDCNECPDPQWRDCPHCQFGQSCPHCGGCGFLQCSRLGACDCTGGFANACEKFLGFIHDALGATEKGVPLLGCYTIVYPVNPSYFDARDGQVYAAPTYGGPVSVPLAPVVRHTYNYGWGVPSSRLTPISHPIHPVATAR